MKLNELIAKLQAEVKHNPKAGAYEVRFDTADYGFPAVHSIYTQPPKKLVVLDIGWGDPE